MPPTWTPLSAKAVGNGRVVAIKWRVEGTETEIGDDPKWPAGATGCHHEAPAIMDAFQFIPDGQVLATGMSVVGGGLIEWTRSGSGSNVTAEFTMRLVGNNGIAVAINSRSHSPTLTILPDKVALRFHHSTLPWEITGPPSTVTGFSLDTSELGIPPGGSDLKLFADAHAESVGQSLAAVDDLTEWINLADDDKNLTSPDAQAPALTSGNGLKPTLVFDATTADHMAMAAADAPAISQTATIAAVFVPPPANSPTQHIIGRWEDGGEAWRIIFDGSESPPLLSYQTMTGGTTIDSLTYELDPADTTVFFVFRRRWDATQEKIIHEMWINGRLTDGVGSVADSPDVGSGDLTIGARYDGADWGDAFDGQINQVAIYDTFVDDAQLSLILHTMAYRAGITLGTPVPETTEFQTQPYPQSNGLVGRPVLGRKPLAVIGLFRGESGFVDNPYGQNSKFWRQSNQADIERWLKTQAKEIINACDDFEIVFRLPGGNYQHQIFHSDVFTSAMNRENPTTNDPMITEDMWDAMAATWLDLNLGEASEKVGRGVPTQRKRRGWFYVGSGFAMDHDAQLTPTGHMFERNVAPASGEIYYNLLIKNWTDRDPGPDTRYRCLMLDASGPWRGMFIPMCASDALQDAGFLFVGEAIAGGDDRARQGAVWYGKLDHSRSPWWRRNTLPPFQYNRVRGYNTQWKGDWETMPVYFSVSDGAYPYLYRPPDVGPTNPGTGDNMTLGDIYRFILKGATPFAQHRSVLKKVGAAWNYATGRLPMNRWDRFGRVSRWQR